MALCRGHALLFHLASIVRALLRILRRLDIKRDRLANLPLRMHPLEEWHAPVASGAGSVAERQLARDTRSFTFEEGGEFPQTNPKAEADMIIRLHQEPSLADWAQLQSLHSPVGNTQRANNMPISIPAVVALMLG